jgi:hypothetical protein
MKNRGYRGYARIKTNDVNWHIRAYPRFCFVFSQFDNLRDAGTGFRATSTDHRQDQDIGRRGAHRERR